MCPELSSAVQQLFEQFAEAELAAQFHPHPFTREEVARRAQYAGRDLYYVLLDDGDAVGYGLLRGWDEGYEIPSLGIAIAPAAQGRGYGRLLMGFLHAAAGARGARQVRLKAYAGNAPAIALYKSMGYVFEAEQDGQLVGYATVNGPDPLVRRRCVHHPMASNRLDSSTERLSNSTPRVLIPSDHRDWIVNFAHGYQELGWDVTTGAQNFDLEASRADVVHFNWPEELTGWRVPSSAAIDETIARLERWARRSSIIVSVNNLYPHGQEKHPAWQRLYAAFFERADVIHHFSEASRRLVELHYPSARGQNHVVSVGFNYDLLLPTGPRDRPRSRAHFQIEDEEIVYFVFGSIRFWDEIRVLTDAFERARVPKKRLLVAARYQEPGPTLQRRWRSWRWEAWQRRHGVVRVEGYVPDHEVHRLFDAADAVVVVRQNSLSSGLPCLGMTFGRLVIAPNCGGIPEYVSGTDNLLYEPGSSEGLADAMERAASMDRERVASKNRQIAAAWHWKGIVTTCIEGLGWRNPRRVVQAGVVR